jgi:L-amino acid N-acyltransferase YncA
MSCDLPLAVVIESMTEQDWTQVQAIYVEGLEFGDATFETNAPDWAHWDAGHLGVCRLVARVAGEVVGWAALSPVSIRQAYSGVAEASLYIAARARGGGVGSKLMAALIESSEQAGIWTLHSSTFPENTASLALQRRFGFRVIGTRERIARHHGRWRDTVLLERRSSVTGL